MRSASREPHAPSGLGCALVEAEAPLRAFKDPQGAAQGRSLTGVAAVGQEDGLLTQPVRAQQFQLHGSARVVLE